MNILVTNDDGYYAGGIKSLVRILSQFGSVTVIAPKRHQSGMGMSVNIGMKPLAYKHLGDIEGVDWSYLDASPASCVKHGFNYKFRDSKPDVVVCGINHGSNASTAACYSGTLGAAEEAAVNGVPAIGVSLDTIRPDADFAVVEKFFPEIFRKLMDNLSGRYGIFYNVNFPNIPAEEIKGVKVGRMGMGKWIREFTPWDPEIMRKHGITEDFIRNNAVVEAEEGEEILMMVGTYVDSPDNTDEADNHIIGDGYISIVAHNLDTTDYDEVKRLKDNGFNIEFQP